MVGCMKLSKQVGFYDMIPTFEKLVGKQYPFRTTTKNNGNMHVHVAHYKERLTRHKPYIVQACVVDLLGLGIIMCGIYHCIVCTSNLDLNCQLPFVPALYFTLKNYRYVSEIFVC